jgi:type IV pilus assembly protein PilC
MPYYQWTGIDIGGQITKGRQLAPSSDFLEKTLLQQNIALMTAQPVKSWPWQQWRQSDSLDFFRQLSALLSSGIFTTDALAILLKQARRDEVMRVIEQLHADICSGISLSAALEKFDTYFNPLVITLLRSGEESGNVARALEALCEHIEFKQQFYRKLRTAALMPGITLLFFIVITAVIITVILPKFASLFTETNQPLPWMTQMLLALSYFVSQWYLFLLAGMAGLVFALRQVKKRYFSSNQFLLSVPFLSRVIVDTSLTYFLKSLTVLMQGGVSLVPALTIAQHSVSTAAIKEQLAGVVDQVSKGWALSEALSTSKSPFFSDDFIAMVKVGEESGNLRSMLEHCSKLYEARVSKALELFSALFQPALMIFIGLMIAFLILAVYVPIFELSNVVSWS